MTTTEKIKCRFKDNFRRDFRACLEKMLNMIAKMEDAKKKNISQLNKYYLHKRMYVVTLFGQAPR